MNGTIFDIKRFAIHDGPGIRTTVFLKGCPLKCVWCHNPEGRQTGKDIWVKRSKCIGCRNCIKVCNENALSVDGDGNTVIDKSKCTFCNKCIDICPSCAIERIDIRITVEQLVNELLKDKMFYDLSGGGITLSGGDPLAHNQFKFVKNILFHMKQHNIHTCLETCLHTKLEQLSEFIGLVDFFLVDIKIFDSKVHEKYAGVSNKHILENFTYLAKQTNNILVRIPLVPDITATKENLVQIADFIKDINPEIPIELLNFNPLAKSKYDILNLLYFDDSAKPFTKKQIEDFYKVMDCKRHNGF